MLWAGEQVSLVVGGRDGRHVISLLHGDHVGVLLSEAVSHTVHLRLGLAAAPSEPVISA